MVVVDDTTRWDLTHQKTHKPDMLYSHYAEEKEKLFLRNSLVVDVGGGTGEDALYFLQKGHSVVLLDISPFALKVAEDKAGAAGLAKKLVARQVDYGLHALPIKDASVNVVYSRISLNYFDREHTIKLFMQIYRILKPGGVAYLSFKSPDDTDEMDYLEKMTTLFEPNVYIENGMLRSRFTTEQLNEMVVEAGIKTYEVTPFKEELGVRREGHKQTLYLNEVAFKKEIS
jgi:ubiquinone/menaquinone biosynthesis C-methylase UbiE